VWTRLGLKFPAEYPLDKKTVAAFLVDEDNQMVKILNIFYGGQDYEAIMSPFKME